MHFICLFRKIVVPLWAKMEKKGYIEVTGARVHNLKNISVRIPQGCLTVITGLSGSGKSSLAFDTIYAEGQRRYIDTFSSYARGYIGNMARPDVDKITGLSPVISIDQKTTSRNPRSTVGTSTEVYDYLRLLYARAAEAYSYNTGEKMVHYTDEQIIDLILQHYAGQKILLMAPLVKGRKGHYKELFERYRKKGFMYVRIDGEVQELVAGMKVDRYKNHFIELVVDRLKAPEASAEETPDRKRLRESVAKAMQQGGGVMMVAIASTAMNQESRTKNQDNIQAPQGKLFSKNLMCPTTGLSYADPIPATFSFNSPLGMCPHCKGLGVVSGADEVAEFLDNWQNNQNIEEPTEDFEEIMVCPECHGTRLNKEALSYRFAGKTIADLANMDINELADWVAQIQEPGAKNQDSFVFSDRQKAIASEILQEISKRLQFMIDVGLGYLSLSRSSDSLSGGESQRIRLATQIGSQLVNVLYILDEPSIGLHQRDNQRLIDSLKQLRDMGNTVIVVEHDEQMMREADWIIDIGPKAGRLGGKVVFEGPPQALLEADSLTAKYLRGDKQCFAPSEAQKLRDSELLKVNGCTGNNLKHVDVAFPLGKMIGVTGVSGSGKSTLINQTLFPILQQHLYRSKRAPMPYESVEGLSLIDKVVAVDQSPIGRSPRSNPATYTGVWNDIRNLFVQLPESQIRGWKAGRFSFNTSGGRCENCNGNGYKAIQMHFMPDVLVPCEVCGGKRYNKETLEVRFKGKTIADVLDMTINQAVEFFESQPYILNKIRTLQDVGLGYVKLGQSSTTLSGGESQRMKLAAELSRRDTGQTVYILDEPTTGLHFEDIRVLLGVLRQLVDKGNTVIIIEHNLDVIRACDYLIDLGPEGGNAGGQIIVTGKPEEVAACKESLTGRYL